AANLLRALVLGVFMTWPTKGLQGPIPPFDNQIEKITQSDTGFVFHLRVPGGPVEMATDRNFLVTQITSIDGAVVEHPAFTASPDGFVFSGNHAVDTSHPGNVADVTYNFDISTVDGFRLPSAVHLQVNNIDVRYTLTACAVKKGTVLKVAPPPSNSH
ncbi:MAG: hypothetical protein V4555_11310, partial [Acidobacteriota bacterium]